MSTTLVDLCAGTASVSLWALAQAVPLTGFMGSKRRWAAELVGLLDADRPDRLVLVDAGPWGDVWDVLRTPDGRAGVRETFIGWTDELPNVLWKRLVADPPPLDPVARVAQYLWLQARSAGTIPVWWSADRARWESPSGSRTEGAHHRGRERRLGPAHDRGAHVMGVRHRVGRRVDVYASSQVEPDRAPDALGARGIQYPATIAARLLALDAIDWSRVEVVRGDVRDVAPIAGAAVLFDPPYQGAPRYAEVLPRADVLAVASRWQAAGARVVVCEGEPLPLAGWTALPLPRTSREWVTASWRVPVRPQLGLPGIAA